jgi:hypothetical protein
MGITTRQFGPNAKGSRLTTAEMDENFNYLNDYGVIATTNEYYVLAGFSGDSPSDGSKASPYPSVAAAISAAVADGHTNFKSSIHHFAINYHRGCDNHARRDLDNN